MFVRLLPKTVRQSTLKDLRQVGFSVVKDSSGKYEATDNGGEVVLEAMPGNHAYLCRLSEKVWKE